MYITKVINNNVIFSKNSQGEEIILTGLGVGFQKKKGDRVEAEKIERTFVLEGTVIGERLSKLLEQIPMEYFYLTDEIVKRAEKRLDKKLDRNIYTTLTDHIYFTVERLSNGMVFANQLLWEIKRFYPDEYQFSLEALDMIREELKLDIPKEEASFLALHFVNAQIGGKAVSEAITMTNMIQDILNLIKYELAMTFNEDTLDYTRFLLHLKFFAQRLLMHEKETTDAGFLYDQVRINMPMAFDCTEKIKKYLDRVHHHTLSRDEQVYLTVHIERVAKNRTNS